MNRRDAYRRLRRTVNKLKSPQSDSPIAGLRGELALALIIAIIVIFVLIQNG